MVLFVAGIETQETANNFATMFGIWTFPIETCDWILHEDSFPTQLSAICAEGETMLGNMREQDGFVETRKIKKGALDFN